MAIDSENKRRSVAGNGRTWRRGSLWTPDNTSADLADRMHFAGLYRFDDEVTQTGGNAVGLRRKRPTTIILKTGGLRLHHIATMIAAMEDDDYL